MATRIFCFVMALAFLVSVVGYGVYWIFRNIQEETETAKTTEEIVGENDAALLAQLRDLGLLEDFEPLGEEKLGERSSEELVTVEEGLEILSGDVVTIKYRHA